MNSGAAIDLLANTFLVKLGREPGSDYVTLTLPDNSSEELEFVDALEWFRLRHGGKMDVLLVERALDECWNFYTAEILIHNYRKVVRNYSHIEPKV